MNVGLMNKYYEFLLAGDTMAADHYARLGKHALDCIGCGAGKVRTSCRKRPVYLV